MELPAGCLQDPPHHRLVRLRPGLPHRGSPYLFALAREIPSAAAQKSIGAAHPKHGSPYIASTVQSVITLVIVLLFAFFTAVQVPDADGIPVDTPALVPYVNIYGLLALIGTAAILLVQAICSAAVIWHFCLRKTHRGNVITTLICPGDRRCRDALRGVAAVGQPGVPSRRRPPPRIQTGVQGRART